jgi:hypothetical protein
MDDKHVTGNGQVLIYGACQLDPILAHQCGVTESETGTQPPFICAHAPKYKVYQDKHRSTFSHPTDDYKCRATGSFAPIIPASPAS